MVHRSDPQPSPGNGCGPLFEGGFHGFHEEVRIAWAYSFPNGISLRRNNDQPLFLRFSKRVEEGLIGRTVTGIEAIPNSNYCIGARMRASAFLYMSRTNASFNPSDLFGTGAMIRSLESFMPVARSKGAKLAEMDEGSKE